MERELYPAGEPDWVIHPAETLKELLEEKHLDPYQFMLDARLDPTYFDALMSGQADITQRVAERLEEQLGTRAELWMRLQADYDARRP